MSAPTAKPFVLGSSSEPIQVSKVALAIIIVFGVISLTALVVALWFLFRYTCSRRWRKSGYAVKDGRNEHKEWWKSANPPVESGGMVDMAYPQVMIVPEPFSEDSKRRGRFYGREI